MRWLEVSREVREGRLWAIGPRTRGGLMIVRSKGGFSVCMKAHAARSRDLLVRSSFGDDGSRLTAKVLLARYAFVGLSLAWASVMGHQSAYGIVSFH